MALISARELLRRSWLRAKKKSPGSRLRVRSRAAFFERLEERALLSAVSWINASGGSWNVTANWSGNAVPRASDDVTIDLPGTVTITHSAGSDTIHSLTSQESLSLSGGTLTVTGTVQGSG